MSFIKITPTRYGGKVNYYVYHKPGSQAVFSVLDELVGDKPHPVTEVPQALEFDGWADDMACVGESREMEDFTIECISEEEYREGSSYKDTPRHLLPVAVKVTTI